MATVLRDVALIHTLPCVEKESDFHRDLDPLLLGLSDLCPCVIHLPRVLQGCYYSWGPLLPLAS